MSITDYTAIVVGSGKLPDDAVIPDPAAAIMLGVSVWTLRRNNPVPPIKISTQRRGRRLGDLRAFTRGTAVQPAT
jgi:hypothetical protein